MWRLGGMVGGGGEGVGEGEVEEVVVEGEGEIEVVEVVEVVVGEDDIRFENGFWVLVDEEAGMVRYELYVLFNR